MTQQLRALGALDWIWFPGPIERLTVVYNSSCEDLMPSSGLFGYCTYMVLVSSQVTPETLGNISLSTFILDSSACTSGVCNADSTQRKCILLGIPCKCDR